MRCGGIPWPNKPIISSPNQGAGNWGCACYFYKLLAFTIPLLCAALAFVACMVGGVEGRLASTGFG